MNKISECNQSVKTGRVFHQEIKIEKKPVFLTDELILKTLPTQQLSQVCKVTEDGKSKNGYYFTSDAFRIFREKINSQNQNFTLSISDEQIAGQIKWFIDHPCEFLDTPTPNPNEYLMTSIRLYPDEIALIRHSINDLLEADSSLLRKLPNPFEKKRSEDGSARYAFSIEIDGEQYDKILGFLDHLLDAADITDPIKTRVRILKKEIAELKTAHLSKPLPEKPFIILDSYLNPPSKDRLEIARLAAQKIPEISKKTELDDYILIRMPLFSEEVGFLRWKLEDAENKLFLQYGIPNPKGTHSEVKSFFVRRDIKWEKIIAALSVLETRCQTERLNKDLCDRVGELTKEAERLDNKVKEESDWYQFKRHGLVIGYGFAIAATSIGIGHWLAKKIVDSRRGPPTSPGTGSRSTEPPPKPAGEESAAPLQRERVNFKSALKLLPSVLLEVGAGMLLLFMGGGALRLNNGAPAAFSIYTNSSET